MEEEKKCCCHDESQQEEGCCHKEGDECHCHENPAIERFFDIKYYIPKEKEPLLAAFDIGLLEDDVFELLQDPDEIAETSLNIVMVPCYCLDASIVIEYGEYVAEQIEGKQTLDELFASGEIVGKLLDALLDNPLDVKGVSFRRLPGESVSNVSVQHECCGCHHEQEE